MATDLLSRAEQALVLSEFGSAEGLARQCLQKAAYLEPQGQECRALLDRAATVAIQALAETDRFGSVRKLLRDSFGPRLEDVPPHSLLLWLALAVDTDARSEAQRLILSLLDSRQPGSAAGWTRRQYLALLHLYVFELLLREIREVAEVMRWVRDTQLPLAPEERQLLLDELAQEQQEGAAAAAAAAAAGAQRDMWQQQQQQHAQRRQERQQERQEVRGKEQGKQAAAGAHPQHHQQQQQWRQQCASAAASVEGRASPTSEIQPEAAEDEEGTGPGASASLGLSWLGGLAAMLLPRALLPGYSSGGSGEGLQGQDGGLVSAPLPHARPPRQQAPPPDPAATLRLLGGTMLGAVLLYATYAERRALQARVRQARRTVGAALGELLRMAFSLNPNPVTAASSAPAWR